MDFAEAVLLCWSRRSEAADRARSRGSADPGLRAGVTSGAHLDPLADLACQAFRDAGMPETSIHRGPSRLELPGYFRAAKKWDVLVVHEGLLVAAIEFKSILGSYGNNMNNRAEEAIGNAADLLQATEAGLVGDTPPWLGYVFLMQDEAKSRSTVKVNSPHFDVDPKFKIASYQKRAELMCRRLVMKRLYNAAWFVTGDPVESSVVEPAPDLTWRKFEASIRGRVGEVLA